MSVIRPSRRSLLAMAAGAAATPGCASVMPQGLFRSSSLSDAEPDNEFSVSRLQADLETYDGFGIHRSGSQADRDTVEWLAKDWRALGYEIEFQPFEVPDNDVLYAELEAGGETATLLAQPPFPAAANAVAQAPLVLTDENGPVCKAKGAILLAEAPYMRASSYETKPFRKLADLALAEDAKALIIVTPGPTGEGVFLNIDPERPYPVTAIAAPGQSALLKRIAESGRSVRLAMPPAKPMRTAHNVIARREGGAQTIIVTTPVSGWTHCAGERGPGIAIMRALAPWLAKTFPQKSILLAGLSGHELEGLGARIFIETKAPPNENVALWLHLGAGIAARNWHETDIGLLPLQSADPQRFLLAAPPLNQAVAPHMKGLSGLEQAYALTPETVAGDLKEIHNAGYENLMGAFGAHRFHHVIGDRMNTTSGALTAPVALAFRDSILSALSGSI
ncbi:hypothetical protein [Hyphococcus luteus]|uniref:hypothetical protein n=1 Tax=Hyphococcus luteus TaxID=2058213 RepID=UPI00105709F6|nr:hypothetical protein [Marinicaulis flavus]